MLQLLKLLLQLLLLLQPQLFLLLFSHPFRTSSSPPVVIDASEFGDLLALSSASHSFGVETPEEDSDQVIEDCGQCITYPIYVGSAEEPPLDDEDLPDPEGLYFDLGDFSFNQIWTYRRASDAPEPASKNRCCTLASPWAWTSAWVNGNPIRSSSKCLVASTSRVA